MAVSSPMIYSNGEVIGVLRYVTSTRLMHRQIVVIAVYAFLALLFVAGIVMASAIALHNVPEGMTIGASYASDKGVMGSAALALALYRRAFRS